MNFSRKENPSGNSSPFALCFDSRRKKKQRLDFIWRLNAVRQQINETRRNETKETNSVIFCSFPFFWHSRHLASVGTSLTSFYVEVFLLLCRRRCLELLTEEVEQFRLFFPRRHQIRRSTTDLNVFLALFWLLSLDLTKLFVWKSSIFDVRSAMMTNELELNKNDDEEISFDFRLNNFLRIFVWLCPSERFSSGVFSLLNLIDKIVSYRIQYWNDHCVQMLNEIYFLWSSSFNRNFIWCIKPVWS